MKRTVHINIQQFRSEFDEFAIFFMEIRDEFFIMDIVIRLMFVVD